MLTLFRTAKQPAACLCCILILVTLSCSKFDDYKRFVKNGENFYPGKPDTVIVNAGENRIRLKLVIADPNVKEYLVLWNNGADSLRLPVSKSASTGDTVSTLITDLDEESYTFNIYTFDADHNRSVMTEAAGIAYGSNYASSLVNRPLKSARTERGITYFEWYAGEMNETRTEIEYTDKNGQLRTTNIKSQIVETVLPDYQSATEFRFRTHYLPDSTAIDTFAVQWETAPAPEMVFSLLDKSKFRPYPLPTDIASGYGWLMEYLWDGQVTEGRGFHTVDGTRPYHFTFDLGVEAQLDELRLWMRQGVYYYGYGNPRRWEIWGSTNPSADGSFDGWMKMLDCESIKPSGLPPGNNSYTESDVAYANAGEIFKLPSNSPRVRYIRFKIIENWSDQLSSHIMEIDLKGDY